jgi:putative NADH-flavin reductase
MIDTIPHSACRPTEPSNSFPSVSLIAEKLCTELPFCEAHATDERPLAKASRRSSPPVSRLADAHPASLSHGSDVAVGSVVKRILLLGATGRTGRHVLTCALAQGLQVVALVRSPDRVTVRSDRLTVMMGSPLNPSDVAVAIEGCDAVVSALNNIHTSDRPWANHLCPPMLMTHCISNCISAMRKEGIRRLVVMSAIGVGNSFAYAPAVLRWLIRHTNLRRSYEDQDAQERILSQSGLEWTSVRVAGLTNWEHLRKLMVGVGSEADTRTSIRRERAARFLLDCLWGVQYIGQTPLILEF